MKKRLSMLVWAAGLGSLLGCCREPAVVPISGLSFPVVVIFTTSTSGTTWTRAEVALNKDDLSRMRVDLFTSRSGEMLSHPPLVIDSAANVCEMKDIKAGHGWLWMMANPQGLMPISFTLVKHKDTGLEAARTLIAACKYLGRDLDDDRRVDRTTRIRRATTMTDIIRIVDEFPTAP